MAAPDPLLAAGGAEFAPLQPRDASFYGEAGHAGERRSYEPDKNERGPVERQSERDAAFLTAMARSE